MNNYVFSKSNVTIIGHNTTVVMRNSLEIGEYGSEFSIFVSFDLG